MNPTKLPKGPWEEVSADFVGPFPTGDLLLVVIDDNSRYPEVEFVSSTSGKAVAPKFDKMFSTFGIPSVVKTDNGPPFNSKDFDTEFKKLSSYLGFKHRKVTPEWPRANGEAERFMKSLNKAIKVGRLENKPMKQIVNEFLRVYRATPHCTTGVCPFELMFNRKPNTRLPQIEDHGTENSSVRERDESKKQKMKKDYDRKHKVSTHNFSVGQKVFLHPI